MRKNFWLFSLIAIMAVGLMVGCSDDDSPTSTIDRIYAGFVTGSIYLEPNVYMGDLVIHGYGAVAPNLDSVRVGDSLLVGDSYLDYDYDEDYHDTYWEIYFNEDGSTATYMYDHGDTANISIYGPGGMATTSLVILDADSASANITSPVHNADTITYGDSEMIYWNKVDMVDYYAIMLGFDEASSNSNYLFYATTDTMFTVTPEMYSDSLSRFWISVVPFNGPDPATGASNVSGDWLTGKIYSMGWDDWIYVYAKPAGGGGSAPALGKGMTTDVRPTELTAEQIVSRVYQQNR